MPLEAWEAIRDLLVEMDLAAMYSSELVEYAAKEAVERTADPDRRGELAYDLLDSGQAQAELDNLREAQRLDNARHRTTRQRTTSSVSQDFQQVEQSSSSEVRALAGNAGMGPSSSHARGNFNFPQPTNRQPSMQSPLPPMHHECG